MGIRLPVAKALPHKELPVAAGLDCWILSVKF